MFMVRASGRWMVGGGRGGGVGGGGGGQGRAEFCCESFQPLLYGRCSLRICPTRFELNAYEAAACR